MFHNFLCLKFTVIFQYREVSEERVRELTALLEDEKKKNEDVQFRLEEASFTKDDIEVSTACS